MHAVDAVCLCRQYDLQSFIGDHVARDNAWLRLLRPEDVKDPAAVRHAIAFSPAIEDLNAYPNLELVSCMGAGVDGLLYGGSLRDNIRVTRVVVREQAQAMAAFAIWHIVNWQRRMSKYKDQQEARVWHPINRLPPSEFPIGLLGYGAIGKTLADALIALGYPVTAYATTARDQDRVKVVSGETGLKKLAETSCAVVNTLPLTKSTEGILSSRLFEHMKSGSILIHLGRGGHLVEDDLIEGLKRGKPAHAALDVFSTEPLPQDHPFWGNPDVFLTPHVAGDANYRDVAAFIADGIAAHDRGEVPAGLVDRTRGY